jgi:hypothetical protein
MKETPKNEIPFIFTHVIFFFYPLFTYVFIHGVFQHGLQIDTNFEGEELVPRPLVLGSCGITIHLLQSQTKFKTMEVFEKIRYHQKTNPNVYPFVQHFHAYRSTHFTN